MLSGDLTREESKNDEGNFEDEENGELSEEMYGRQSNSVANCVFGQTYNEVTEKCEEENLCVSLHNPCGNIMECEPLWGNFKCHIKKINSTHCPEGYKMRNGYCEDINECEEHSKCAKPKVCNNYEGGYTCTDSNEKRNEIDDSETSFEEDLIFSNVNNCGKGYIFNLDEEECVDFDECKTQTHNCKHGTICKNIDGSFTCEQIKCEGGKSVNVEGRCVDSPIQKSCSP
ncbi:fibulin-1-like protein, partial [Leptotrombidium deliense]